MKFFLDTADVDEIAKANDMGLLDGVTTNPSLVAKTGRKFSEVIVEILDIVKGPVSLEVVSTDYDGMMREAEELLKQGDDVVIQAGSVHKKRILAFRLSGSGATTKAEKIWEEIRAAPELASPIVYNGLLFTVSDGGVLTCFDPQTGEQIWRKRLPS